MSDVAPLPVKPVKAPAAAPVAAPAAPSPATLDDNGPGRYRVEFNEASGEYEAANRDEAWARFNDAHKTSHGPKVAGRKIAKLS